MRRPLKILVFVGVVGAICMFRGSVAHATNDPFVCSPDFYQVISGQLNKLNPTDGTYTNIGSQQADTYNAIGYDTLDNYIYGIKTSVTDSIGAIGNLVRIGGDGTLTDLGPISGISPPTGFVNGSMDNAGNLYIRSDIHTILKVNVGNMPAANTVSATTITTTGDSIVTGSDNVFINNKLYLIVGTSMSVVDLTTNNVTTVTVSGPSGWANPGDNFGAGWTDQAGELFFSSNNTGSIYQISNITANTATATFKVAGTVTSNNDGANCPLAVSSPFAPATPNTGYGTHSQTDYLAFGIAATTLASSIGLTWFIRYRKLTRS